VERFFQRGIGLTNANTGLPETYSSFCSVSGVAPAGRTRRVTTPLYVDDEVEVLDVEAPVEAPEPEPETEPPDKDDPPELPDGNVVTDGEGEGRGVVVLVGVGVGVGVAVGDGDGEGEGEGLPESSEAAGSTAPA
jgi:hypothetical protein